ncbi:glycosyl transferase, partial [Escherichia coli]|nr:glycosyl transferase [Escherichia coli]
NDILNGNQNEQAEICAKKMKEIATKKYTWDTIAKMYEELY